MHGVWQHFAVLPPTHTRYKHMYIGLPGDSKLLNSDVCVCVL